MPLSGSLIHPLGGSSVPVNVPIVGEDHVAAATARLIEQFKDKPNFVAMVSLLAAPAQDVEKVVQDLLTLPQIDASSGAQLDVLGKRIGEQRQGFDDATYRLHLKARIWLNRGSGTPEDIYGLFRFLVSPSCTLWLEEHFPAAFTLHVGGSSLDSTLTPYLVQFLRAAKDLGVNCFLHWLNDTDANSFAFAGATGLGFDQGIFSSER